MVIKVIIIKLVPDIALPNDDNPMINGWFGGYGGNSIAITGSANGSHGTLKGIRVTDDIASL